MTPPPSLAGTPSEKIYPCPGKRRDPSVGQGIFSWDPREKVTFPY